MGSKVLNVSEEATRYRKLNLVFLKRFWKTLANLERHDVERYKSDSLSACPKSVFVRRTFSKWFSGKKLVVILDEETGFSIDGIPITRKVKSYIQTSHISYSLGRRDELYICFNNASDPHKIASRKISFNGLLALEFYEISDEEFFSVFNLFLDDRPLKDFNAVYYNFSSDTDFKSKLIKKVKARDRQDAFLKFEDFREKSDLDILFHKFVEDAE